jgi:hypothetical protein
MTTYSASRTIGISVVACKTNKGIVRAIAPTFGAKGYNDAINLIESVLRYVGIFNREAEWTAMYYPGQPYYLGYGDTPGWPDVRGDDIRCSGRTGVYLYPWVRAPDDNVPEGVSGKGEYLGPVQGHGWIKNKGNWSNP